MIEQDDIPSGPQRNKLPQFRTNSGGGGDSRATKDTLAERSLVQIRSPLTRRKATAWQGSVPTCGAQTASTASQWRSRL